MPDWLYDWHIAWLSWWHAHPGAYVICAACAATVLAIYGALTGRRQ
jgi:hypothetical protein